MVWARLGSRKRRWVYVQEKLYDGTDRAVASPVER